MDRKTVTDVFAFQRGYLSMLVDDIPNERLASPAGGIVNHPAWQIGHLAFAADGVCEMLGGTKRLDKAWAEKYGMGSKPVADRGAYPSKSDLLGTLDECRSRLSRQFAQASDEMLRRPNPFGPLAAGLPTLGHAATFFMVFHEGTHLGQLAAWRKAAGMVEALSKLGA